MEGLSRQCLTSSFYIMERQFRAECRVRQHLDDDLVLLVSLWDSRTRPLVLVWTFTRLADIRG